MGRFVGIPLFMLGAALFAAAFFLRPSNPEAPQPRVRQERQSPPAAETAAWTQPPVEPAPPASPPPAAAALPPPIPSEEAEEEMGEIDSKYYDPMTLLKEAAEDPVALMERELRLSPSQALVVQKHVSDRSVAYGQLLRSPLRQTDPMTYQVQYGNMIDHYDRMILGGLDSTQAEKYRELKQAGKFVVIFPVEAR